MTLADIIARLENEATKQVNVGSIIENDIFVLNAIPDVTYGVFAWTQGQHSLQGDVMRYSLTLFYVDRLTADKGNQLEVQSVGIATLTNIIRGLEDIYPDMGVTFTTFNQRFGDECAGVFCNININAPVGGICAEDTGIHWLDADGFQMMTVDGNTIYVRG